MDVSPLRLAQLLVPRIPLLLKTIVLSKLSMSTNSDKQDTRTEVVVTMIRSIMSSPRPLEVIQRGSIKDLPIKGKMWIAKADISAPETDVRDAVIRVIKDLGDGSEDFSLPDLCDISGEWTGYRECDKRAPRMEIPEKEQYEHMMKEVTSDATVLYFHGGAYFLMDPASHRAITSGLAKKTGGRCFSVRYRLAPQAPFPAQILDALISYLYLVAPPDGAFHEPVPPNKIVFAGDSAGGNLACSLLLLLVTLKKAGLSAINFHGKSVPLELPAGIAVNSAWTDISRALPTIYKNARFDYLDPPSETGVSTNFPKADSIWPSNPPRAEIYCNASMLSHPLASPVLATPEMWSGAPPVFMCCGNETLEDEVVVTARRLYQAGVAVEFAAYEGMPHCFAMVFPTSVAGKDCMDKWTDFISDAAGGRVTRKPAGYWMEALSNPPRFREVDLATMGLPDEEVQRRITEVKDRAVLREQEAVKKWESETRAKL